MESALVSFTAISLSWPHEPDAIQSPMMMVQTHRRASGTPRNPPGELSETWPILSVATLLEARVVSSADLEDDRRNA